jgi:hypothetical protein
MHEQEHHAMVLSATHSSGAEEWFCPTCGRRFLLRWPPSYQKLVLEAGDEYALHSGSKGDMLRMMAPDIDAAPPGDDLPAPHGAAPLASEPALTRDAEDDQPGDVPITDELRPWVKWLEQSNLDPQGDEPA